MDEQEGKRDIVAHCARQSKWRQPNLRSYYRVVRKAKVVASYASDGQYYCDVQPLKNDETADENEPVIPAVAIPVMWGRPEARHRLARRQSGRCAIFSYYDGDPELSLYFQFALGHGPGCAKGRTERACHPAEDGAEIRIDKEKNIVTLTPENVKTENGKTGPCNAAKTQSSRPAKTRASRPGTR